MWSTHEAPMKRLRAFETSDYTAMAAVATAIFPDDPRDPSNICRRDELWDHARYDLLRIIAENAAGDVVGWGQINHLPHNFDPAVYRIGIYVLPQWQRQGFGTAMYETLLAELSQRSASRITVRSRADQYETNAFLDNRGFKVIEETAESRLSLESFDLRRAETALQTLQRHGIDVRTYLAEQSRNPSLEPDLFALYLACLRDVPGGGVTTEIGFEQFVARELRSSALIADLLLLAVSGEQYVGMCEFIRHPALPTVLVGRMTGSLPAFRGRGIVSTLKLQLAARAKTNGFREIWTWNSTQNHSMLRINEAVCFVPSVTWQTRSLTL
jgi:ribosomal protein S18 acetylase RimI-like enzyme